MEKSKNYYLYIITNFTKNVFYIGITNNLHRRLYEHRNELIDGFSKKYKCKYLIYYEEYIDINETIAREKQIKKWSRSKKFNLIKTKNHSLKFIDI